MRQHDRRNRAVQGEGDPRVLSRTQKRRGGRVGAIVVAAGASTRLPGRVPKPFLRVGRNTILGLSLVAFERSSEVDDLVVVASAGFMKRACRLAERFRKTVAVVSGGERRQDSVRAGLAALPHECDLIVIHDGARPLVTTGMIEQCAETARSYGAAIQASAVVDTLKDVDDGVIVGTVDRTRVWRAETPQAFRRSWLERAYAANDESRIDMTDDAGLLENVGLPVRVVPSLSVNIKVTSPGDVVLVRALVAAERRRLRNQR